MKKTLVSLLIAFIALPASAAFTLYEYYEENLPSIKERAKISYEAGLTGYSDILGYEYTGTYEQNISLLEYLLNNKEAELGFAPSTGYSQRLTTSISSSVSVIPVSSVNDVDGIELPCSSTNRCYFNLEPGTSREERVVCTGISASTLTGCTRGLLATGESETGSSTLASAHNAGAKIIMTNIAQFFSNYLDTSTDQTATGTKTFINSPIVPSPTTDYQVAPKIYVDTVAQQGGATSTETVIGISQLATQTEQANNTFTADEPQVLSTKYASSTEGSNFVVITDSNGEIDNSFIDENQYTFASTTIGGDLEVTGTTTLATSTIPTNTITGDTNITNKQYVDYFGYSTVCFAAEGGIPTDGSTSYLPFGITDTAFTSTADARSIAVATTTVDRFYTYLGSNLGAAPTFTFIGGTGDTLSTSYSSSETGNKNDTLTESKTMTPGTSYYVSVTSPSGTSASQAHACVRFKIQNN